MSRAEDRAVAEWMSLQRDKAQRLERLQGVALARLDLDLELDGLPSVEAARAARRRKIRLFGRAALDAVCSASKAARRRFEDRLSDWLDATNRPHNPENP